MANMLGMLKEAASMKKKMKKMQKELHKKTVECSSGGVTACARGDMSIAWVKINADEVTESNIARLEKMTATACNKALELAKKQAGQEMSKMTGGLGGLADMLGG